MIYKFLLLSIILMFQSFSVASLTSNIKCDSLDKATELRKIQKKELSKIKFKYDITGMDFDRKTKKLKRVVQTINVTPEVGVKLKSGFLLGHSRGEWGGSLIFKSSKKEIELLKDNIENIHAFQSGYIVTAGLSHLMSDRGNLYFVKKNKHSGFTIIKLYTLPSKPVSSWVFSNKEILIHLSSGESYILNSSGELSKVACSP